MHSLSANRVMAAITGLDALQSPDSEDEYPSDMEVVLEPSDPVLPPDIAAAIEAEDLDTLSLMQLQARLAAAESTLEDDSVPANDETPAPPTKERKLSTMRPSKARQYVRHTLGFKLGALRKLQDNKGNISLTARQLQLKDPKTLRDWRSQQDTIVAEVKAQLQRNRKGVSSARWSGGGTKPHWDKIGVELVAWLQVEQQCCPVAPPTTMGRSCQEVA